MFSVCLLFWLYGKRMNSWNALSVAQLVAASSIPFIHWLVEPTHPNRCHCCSLIACWDRNYCPRNKKAEKSLSLQSLLGLPTLSRDSWVTNCDLFVFRSIIILIDNLNTTLEILWCIKRTRTKHFSTSFCLSAAFGFPSPRYHLHDVM